jgi:anti-anti-sigma factor
MRHWDRTRQDGPLTVKVEHAGDALTVRATGELNRSTAETFEAELRLVISGDAETVELDLGGVGLIDSTGLRSVLRIGNHSPTEAGFGRVSSPSKRRSRGAGFAQKKRVVDWASTCGIPRARCIRTPRSWSGAGVKDRSQDEPDPERSRRGRDDLVVIPPEDV